MDKNNMAKKSPKKWTVVAALVFLSGCSLGGIVDNGDKPITAHPARGDSIRVVDLVAGFETFLPDNSWSAAASATNDAATLIEGPLQMTFTVDDGSKAADACHGPEIKNDNGVLIETCDDTHVALVPDEGDAILVEFSERTSDVDFILRNVRKKAAAP